MYKELEAEGTNHGQGITNNGERTKELADGIDFLPLGFASILC